MDLTLSRRNRAPLEPQRDVGRQRVAELLQAAAAVFQERGFEAATMAEIAARADAKIGSLYRFFPNKDAVADALMRRYAEALQAEYDATALYRMTRSDAPARPARKRPQSRSSSGSPSSTPPNAKTFRPRLRPSRHRRCRA